MTNCFFCKIIKKEVGAQILPEHVIPHKTPHVNC
jgi:hypothetical protein